MRRPRWLALLALLVPQLAVAAPAAVSLRAAPCVSAIVSEGALLDALRVEVPSSRARAGPHSPAVTLAEEDASHYVQLSCPAPEVIEVLLTRRSPAAASQARVALSDVSPAARPRTLALAISEQLRSLEIPLGLGASPPSPGQQRRLRLTGGLTIGLFALSLAGAVIGSGLYGIARSGPGGDAAPALVPPGIALLSIGGAALVGGGVTLTLWLRERRRAPR